jgi:hypothetical protein
VYTYLSGNTERHHFSSQKSSQSSMRWFFTPYWRKTVHDLKDKIVEGIKGTNHMYHSRLIWSSLIISEDSILKISSNFDKHLVGDIPQFSLMLGQRSYLKKFEHIRLANENRTVALWNHYNVASVWPSLTQNNIKKCKIQLKYQIK